MGGEINLDLPAPRDQGPPQICIIHDRELEIKNAVILQCPEEECEIIAVRGDLQKLALYYVNCKACNYCYPSPDPEKCVICDEDTREILERRIKIVRG